MIQKHTFVVENSIGNFFEQMVAQTDFVWGRQHLQRVEEDRRHFGDVFLQLEEVVIEGALA